HKMVTEIKGAQIWFKKWIRDFKLREDIPIVLKNTIKAQEMKANASKPDQLEASQSSEKEEIPSKKEHEVELDKARLLKRS
ncbi:hypothetical protein HAX54_038532, partial [Datura stramonium]|nr:hypothetical protein [Datura stramonium]